MLYKKYELFLQNKHDEELFFNYINLTYSFWSQNQLLTKYHKFNT